MAWFDRRVQRMVPPWPGEYANMLLHAGGADGRKTVGGWASWSQAWPAVAAGASDDSGGFDVSDVDTDVTSIPDPDCETVYPGPSRTMGLSCMLWARVPDAGVAGSHVDRSKSPSAVYVQLKASIPEGEAELEALKQKLFPDYRDDIDEVVLIPVKYDFGELWRWAEILDRFSLSAANTIGIEGASVHRNAKANSGTVTLFPVDGLRPAEWEDKAAWRNTILVGALDGHRVVEALPELLPLLGIPVDAVGRVVQVSERPITSEAQPW